MSFAVGSKGSHFSSTSGSRRKTEQSLETWFTHGCQRKLIWKTLALRISFGSDPDRKNHHHVKSQKSKGWWKVGTNSVHSCHRYQLSSTASQLQQWSRWRMWQNQTCIRSVSHGCPLIPLNCYKVDRRQTHTSRDSLRRARLSHQCIHRDVWFLFTWCSLCRLSHVPISTTSQCQPWSKWSGLKHMDLHTR